MSDARDQEDNLAAIPARSKVEVGVGVAEAVISGVPMVGGPVEKLFELVIGPSLTKRRDAWLRKLGEVVQELRDRLDGFDPRDLEGNEPFVSAVVAASTIAVRTHEADKLDMLRNALVNSVLPTAPDEHERVMFLRFVDELTPLHVAVLGFFSDPAAWFEGRGLAASNVVMGAVAQALEAGIPELAGRRELYGQLARELDQRGLTDVGSALHAVMTASGVWTGRATSLGLRFLAFISDPPTGDGRTHAR